MYPEVERNSHAISFEEYLEMEEKDLWRISNVANLKESLHLHSLDIEIPLEDIYYQIESIKK